MMISKLLAAVCTVVCMTVQAEQQSSIYQSGDQKFRLEPFVSELGSPWAMAFLPGGELLISERSGALRMVVDGKLLEKPIAGVPEVRARGQGGLLDLELHPDYEKPDNRWIYISYSSPVQSGESGRGANTALMRARLSEHKLIDQQILFKAQPNYRQTQHYGGRIQFDDSGYVYLTVGDRGGRDEVQQLSNYRGKIFRLHDDGTIPSDNPFVGVPDAIDSIWSYGHRNPQGFASHPESGELWSHEHGPRGGDELNIVGRGKNYGWPVITYGINYNGTTITDETARPGMEQPITYWVPSIAPSGLSFVTGDKYPAWRGNLFVGSLKFQKVERLELDGEDVVHEESMLDGIGRVRAIEQSPDGYLYIAVENPGKIVKLVPVN